MGHTCRRGAEKFVRKLGEVITWKRRGGIHNSRLIFRMLTRGGINNKGKEKREVTRRRKSGL